jgi:hypothetical protein
MSIQHVDSIEGDAVTFQKTKIFPCEGSFPVVNFLISDVVPKVIVIESGDCKRSVPLLPLEILSVGKCLVYPTASVRLDRGNQL